MERYQREIWALSFVAKFLSGKRGGSMPKLGLDMVPTIPKGCFFIRIPRIHVSGNSNSPKAIPLRWNPRNSKWSFERFQVVGIWKSGERNMAFQMLRDKLSHHVQKTPTCQILVEDSRKEIGEIGP